jgi:hypothetical protein
MQTNHSLTIFCFISHEDDSNFSDRYSSEFIMPPSSSSIEKRRKAIVLSYDDESICGFSATSLTETCSIESTQASEDWCTSIFQHEPGFLLTPQQSEDEKEKRRTSLNCHYQEQSLQHDKNHTVFVDNCTTPNVEAFKTTEHSISHAKFREKEWTKLVYQLPTSERNAERRSTLIDRREFYTLYPGELSASRERTSNSSNMIEISPGINKHLRGAAETYQAVEEDYYLPNNSLCCSQTIFAIADASLYLCPVCLVVNPFDTPKPFSEYVNGGGGDGGGGVGLGLTFDDLSICQEHILNSRK